MSSLHNDLATWAAKAKAAGQDTIYLSVSAAEKAAQQIVALSTELEAVKAENVRLSDLISIAPEILEVVQAFVAETVDYATINKLGDPEKQHNVKWARSLLNKAGALEGRR